MAEANSTLCANCGAAFNRTGRQIYCSPSCRHKAKYKRRCEAHGPGWKRRQPSYWKRYKTPDYDKKQTVFTCASCDTLFLRLPGMGYKWCSDACKPVSNREKLKQTKTICFCQNCDEPFIPRNAHPIAKWCSRKCRDQHSWRNSTEYQLNVRMRFGMRRSLMGDKGRRSWRDLVGYSTDELARHIERQFVRGMTWEKFRAGAIHIDHIIPLSSFEYSSPEDEGFRLAWSLTNLRPMWAEKNIAKGAKVTRLI